MVKKSRKNSGTNSGSPVETVESESEKIFDAETGEEVVEAKPLVEEKTEMQETPVEPVQFEDKEQHEPEPEPPQPREREKKPHGNTGKKYKKRQREERETDSPEALTEVLLGLHQMGAAFTQIPELLLRKDEAERLANNIHAVEKYYSDRSWMSEEVSIWVNLSISIGMVYIPRYIAIKKRMRSEEPIDITVGKVRPNGSTINLEPESGSVS